MQVASPHRLSAHKMMLCLLDVCGLSELVSEDGITDIKLFESVRCCVMNGLISFENAHMFFKTLHCLGHLGQTSINDWF